MQEKTAWCFAEHLLQGYWKVYILGLLSFGFVAGKATGSLHAGGSGFYLPEDTLPRYYREAVVLYHAQRNDSVSVSDSLMLKRFDAYRQLQRQAASPLEERNRMRREFGDTYWWYYDYQE